MGLATLAWHGLWQCLLSAPVRAKNTGSWGYTHCLEKGTTRLAVNRDRGLGFMFPAGHSLPELSPGLAQHLQTLSPCLFSSPPSKCLSLTHLFLPISCGCFFSDSPSSSQEHRVSGIGKPILRSSSDPPVNSRCPKPEEPTPSPAVDVCSPLCFWVSVCSTFLWKEGVCSGLLPVYGVTQSRTRLK